jgi:RNA 2',3'-cyclic 3'-phosphodiesterase
MRLFVSIEIPGKIKSKISKMVEKLKNHLTPVKWMENKNLHVTLKFLGWVEDEKIGKLMECLKKSVKGLKPFELSFAGIGYFPDRKHPRVIWVGTEDGSEKVKRLADKIDGAAAAKGFREEEKEYTSHLTIGRIKEKIDTDALTKYISEHEGSKFGKFRVDHISLMKSTLRRSGPIYEEIEQIKLI